MSHNVTQVRCGEWDARQQTEPFPHQDRKVAAIKIHPEFAAINLNNDFAVLFTSEEFVLTSHIDIACLPQPGETFHGTTCFATGGWREKFGAQDEDSVILKVQYSTVQYSTVQ